MHPNTVFDWKDKAEMLAFVAERSFAHIFTSSEAGNFVVHAPVVVTAEGHIRFHISRRNRAAAQIANRRLLLSLAAHDGYQSANWYASEDQVPTWHYESVEIEGIASELNEAGIIALLDELSILMEEQYSPERPWTRAKMTPGKFEAMLNSIVGFEVTVEAIRGTRKFNQHKHAADLNAALEGQLSAGREDIAAAMRAVRK